MDRIFVVGASGHAGVIVDILEKQRAYEIAGLVDSNVSAGAERHGFPVWGAESDVPRLMAEHGVTGGIVAIGDNFVRHRMVEQIRRLAPQFRFISAVHPSAQLARGVSVGCGSAVMAGVVINSNSKIGEHCIINTGASVDHDNVLDRFSSIGPGAVTGGNVRLGEFSVLAMSASVIHGRSIGAQSIIGAGATVLHDVPANVVAYGTPARVIRGRNPGDKYL